MLLQRTPQLCEPCRFEALSFEMFEHVRQDVEIACGLVRSVEHPHDAPAPWK
jgi:hypothetical protein